MNDLLDEHDEKDEENLPHHELTSPILGCCFEVMNELGPGFLERLYKGPKASLSSISGKSFISGSF